MISLMNRQPSIATDIIYTHLGISKYGHLGRCCSPRPMLALRPDLIKRVVRAVSLS